MMWLSCHQTSGLSVSLDLVMTKNKGNIPGFSDMSTHSVKQIKRVFDDNLGVPFV